MSPAPETGRPFWSKTARLSVGELKFEWLRILKNSARNWTLKLSENRLLKMLVPQPAPPQLGPESFFLKIRLFLKTEKSNFESPGPIRVLRPRFPRRVLGLGNARHWVLM